MIKIDWKNIRYERQKLNNQYVFNSIINNNLKEFNKYTNIKEFNRILDDLELTKEQLFDMCKENEIMCKILSGRISKNSSRQGIKDEQYQLTICNNITDKINIINLKQNEYTPLNNGEIVFNITNVQYNLRLKSFEDRKSVV